MNGRNSAPTLPDSSSLSSISSLHISQNSLIFSKPINRISPRKKAEDLRPAFRQSATIFNRNSSNTLSEYSDRITPGLLPDTYRSSLSTFSSSNTGKDKLLSYRESFPRRATEFISTIVDSKNESWTLSINKSESNPTSQSLSRNPTSDKKLKFKISGQKSPSTKRDQLDFQVYQKDFEINPLSNLEANDGLKDLLLTSENLENRFKRPLQSNKSQNLSNDLQRKYSYHTTVLNSESNAFPCPLDKPFSKSPKKRQSSFTLTTAPIDLNSSKYNFETSNTSIINQRKTFPQHFTFEYPLQMKTESSDHQSYNPKPNIDTQFEHFEPAERPFYQPFEKRIAIDSEKHSGNSKNGRFFSSSSKILNEPLYKTLLNSQNPEFSDRKCFTGFLKEKYNSTNSYSRDTDFFGENKIHKVDLIGTCRSQSANIEVKNSKEKLENKNEISYECSKVTKIELPKLSRFVSQNIVANPTLSINKELENQKEEKISDTHTIPLNSSTRGKINVSPSMKAPERRRLNTSPVPQYAISKEAKDVNENRKAYSIPQSAIILEQKEISKDDSRPSSITRIKLHDVSPKTSRNKTPYLPAFEEEKTNNFSFSNGSVMKSIALKDVRCNFSEAKNEMSPTEKYQFLKDSPLSYNQIIRQSDKDIKVTAMSYTQTGKNLDDNGCKYFPSSMYSPNKKVSITLDSVILKSHQKEKKKLFDLLDDYCLENPSEKSQEELFFILSKFCKEAKMLFVTQEEFSGLYFALSGTRQRKVSLREFKPFLQILIDRA